MNDIKNYNLIKKEIQNNDKQNFYNDNKMIIYKQF